MARRARTPEGFERYFPGFKAFADSTEQAIPRPKNATKRKTHYSGERKEHGHDAAHSQFRGSDRPQDQSCKGKEARPRHLPRASSPLPKEVKQDFDRGYDGIKNYFPDLNCANPYKQRGPGRGHRGEKEGR